MNIVVCLKMMDGKAFTNGHDIGPYDLYSLNKALELKKNNEDISVICISMGPDAAKTMLKMAVALGSDRAILISDKCYAGSDTVNTSYILGNAIRRLPDIALVFCGNKSFHGETGFVGPGIAQLLGAEYFVSVQDIEYCNGWWKLSKMDNAGSCCLKVKELGVVRCSGIETGAFTPNLYTIKRANRCSIEVWSNSDLGLDPDNCGIKGSKTDVIKVSFIQRENRKNLIIYDDKEAMEIILSEAGVNSCNIQEEIISLS